MKVVFPFAVLIGMISQSCGFQETQSGHDQTWHKAVESEDFFEYAHFIQEYPNSEHFNTALANYFSLREAYEDSAGVPLLCCLGNCGRLELDSNGRIMFEGEVILIDSLRSYALEFLINESQDPTMPSQKRLALFTGKPGYVSKGYFEIYLNQDSTGRNQIAITQVSNAIQDYKAFLSETWFNTSIKSLDEKRADYIDSVLYVRLNLYDFIPVPPPPPPDE
ncbi:hypothetical protein [Owenweeksia hongkongensis]|uniref:hypothetical protein n=1 Tax=Owenweeksia hongkongensis TaxID=253245 RepID=UPI003A8D3788